MENTKRFAFSLLTISGEAGSQAPVFDSKKLCNQLQVAEIARLRDQPAGLATNRHVIARTKLPRNCVRMVGISIVHFSIRLCQDDNAQISVIINKVSMRNMDRYQRPACNCSHKLSTCVNKAATCKPPMIDHKVTCAPRWKLTSSVPRFDHKLVGFSPAATNEWFSDLNTFFLLVGMITSFGYHFQHSKCSLASR